MGSELGPGDGAVRDFLRSVPKSELHLHLGGAFPRRTFAEIVARTPRDEVRAAFERRSPETAEYPLNIQHWLATLDCSDDGLRRLFQYDDFKQFLATYQLVGSVVRDADDFALLVDGVLADLRAEHVVYAEIMIDLGQHLAAGIPPVEIRRVLEGASRASGTIEPRWICDLGRDWGPAAAEETFAALLAMGSPDFVAVTLGGQEDVYPPADFAALFRAARGEALHLVTHADETRGPRSIWDAIEVLGVERIGHGISAAGDPRLMEALREWQIPLEVCVSSNLRTGVVGQLHEHPILDLIAEGVPVTVSSDDPTFFGTTIVGDPDEVVKALGDMLNAAMDSGATRVTVQIDRHSAS